MNIVIGKLGNLFYGKIIFTTEKMFKVTHLIDGIKSKKILKEKIFERYRILNSKP